VAAALAVVVRSGTLYGVMSLFVCALAASGLLALLDAPFVAVAHAAIFGGSSIIMLFVSAAMKGPGAIVRNRGTIKFGRIIATIAAFYFAVVVVVSILRPPFVDAPLSGESFRELGALGTVLGMECASATLLVGLAVLVSIISVLAIMKYGLEEKKG
jgi:NADH:ubiquinone oxidoreductase subunit 6 (subunit J)